MSRFRSVLRLFVAVVVGAYLFDSPNEARAAFAIQAKTDGGAFETVFTSGSSGAIAETMEYKGLSLSITSANDPTMSSLVVKVLEIFREFDSSIVIQVSRTELLTGPPPQTLTSAFTGSSDGNVSMRTFISSGNTLFAEGDLVSMPSGQGLGTSNTAQFTGTPGSYTITTEISVSGLTSMDFINSLDSNNTIVGAPAPTGVVLAMSSLPVWGFGLWFRRRRATLAG